MLRLTALLLLVAIPAAADQSISYQTLVTPVLQAQLTTLGQPIVYPPGSPRLTAVIVGIPAGGQTGWHTHPVPLFAYMLEGELTVDYGEKGTKTYKAGEGVMEAENWPHNGINKTDKPVRLLAVYLGADGLPNATAVPNP